MAKRFIDTLLFTDEWFCELSKDGKLFFLYYITSCDHAGVLRLNNKLCEFQTSIKSCETVIKELGNCLITIKQGVYFMPKYIKFQYPKFPQSAVKQQESAINILKSYNLWDFESNSYLTVTKDLLNHYVNDSVIVNEEIIKGEEEIKMPSIISYVDLPLDSNLRDYLFDNKLTYKVSDYEKDIKSLRPFAILWLLMNKRGAKEKGYDLFIKLSEDEKLNAYKKALHYKETEFKFIPHVERFLKNNDFTDL
jgi:hypothetical protein